MSQPNFIVFLTDDQGYGDLSCMGATDFRTPHLDRLAASGARFTDWYSNAPVCSPARAALLSGRYPGNAGVRSILAGHRTATGLPPHVPALPELLKPLGYQTAMFGKWHLGLADGCRPNDHGFDDWFGFMAGCVDFFSHIFYWDRKIDPIHDLWENDREVWHNGEYLTDVITRRSVEWIRQAARRDEPFFLFVSYNAPHYPMHAPKKYVDRFPHLAPDRRIMAAMLSAIDDGVGEIMAELERQNIVDDTCVAFTSDNGPSRETRNWLDGRTDPYYGGTTGQLKGHKFSLYEGGIRVPGIVSWPDRISPGQIVDAPCASMDLAPTIVKAAGGEPADHEFDGIDILPCIGDGLPLSERPLFFEQGDQTALRQGRWKLVLNGRLVEGAPPADDVHLADLSQDMAERENLAEAEPKRAAAMKDLAEQWRAGIEERWQHEFAPAPTGTTTHK